MKKALLFFSLCLSCVGLAQVQVGVKHAPTASVVGTSKHPKDRMNNDVLDIVDSPAEFPGGINVFRQEVSNNLRIKNVNSGRAKSIRCEVHFIVERDGSITEIKAFGDNTSFNKEAIKAVQEIRKKWVPAKYNGYFVRSKYRLPLTISFE